MIKAKIMMEEDFLMTANCGLIIFILLSQRAVFNIISHAIFLIDY